MGGAPTERDRSEMSGNRWLSSSSLFAALCAGTAFVVAGCSSPSPSFAFPVDDAGVDAAPADGGPDVAVADEGPDAAPTGPTLFFHVRTNTAPFTHTDGYSGQTARKAYQGVRKLRVYRDTADPSPLVVFDHGAGFVEAGYNAGDDTIVGSTSLAKVPSTRFKLARMTVTHSRYVVSSTLHYLTTPIPGDFDCVQTLSDNVTIDGTVRARGWYRYIFNAMGKSYPQEGLGAPLPSSPTTGGFTMKTDGGETYYELPIDLVADGSIKKDVHLVVDVNMFESYRWEDQDLAGYTRGVFDTTPISYEPIRRFGANSYVVRYE
jgi:hypothetical protein